MTCGPAQALACRECGHGGQGPIATSRTTQEAHQLTLLLTHCIRAQPEEVMKCKKWKEEKKNKKRGVFSTCRKDAQDTGKTKKNLNPKVVHLEMNFFSFLLETSAFDT